MEQYRIVKNKTPVCLEKKTIWKNFFITAIGYAFRIVENIAKIIKNNTASKF